MKCYTVRGEEVRRGLEIVRNAEGAPVLKIGSGEEKSELPVSTALTEMFKARAEAIQKVREGFEGPTEDSEKMRQIMIEVTGKDNLDYWDVARGWAQEDPDVMLLEKADLSTNEPWRLIKERRKTDTALVHFVMECPGQQDLYANTCEEIFVDCRHPYVRKSYNTFPPPGVGVAAIGTGARGEQQGLFLMYPRSAFRVHRDEEPPVLVVAWPGSTLKCFAPAKYRQTKVKKRKKKRGRAA